MIIYEKFTKLISGQFGNFFIGHPVVLLFFYPVLRATKLSIYLIFYVLIFLIFPSYFTILIPKLQSRMLENKKHRLRWRKYTIMHAGQQVSLVFSRCTLRFNLYLSLHKQLVIAGQRLDIASRCKVE